MQSLCPDGQRDEFGFLQYQNSTVSQLLERISQVAEQNRLFTSEGPGLGQELETLQQHLDSLSSAPSSPDLTFNKTQDVTLASVLKDQTLFQQVLLKNFSLSKATTRLLLHTPVSLTAVRRLLLGTRDGERNQSLELGPGGTSQKPEDRGSSLQEGASAGVEGPDGGLLHEALRDPAEAAGRRTLPRGNTWGARSSDGTEDQRKDQQALRTWRYGQRSLRHASSLCICWSRYWSRSKNPS
ncbi:ATP-binding cassette sub-family A member 2-like [Takifugu rubripes]|uniref:ATP-binding cassette sub-family A member 2-like n=1 Tax=Takifugu rubripes TaxID=31033 RepID=UPI001145A3D0|nr:ATP-binding cassette sub-family A member 2-like [Takifugu rubripes]